MISAFQLHLLKTHYPQIAQGEEDATAGKWREVEGDYESMAYEVGRMLSLEPPIPTNLPGIFRCSPFLERAIREL